MEGQILEGCIMEGRPRREESPVAKVAILILAFVVVAVLVASLAEYFYGPILDDAERRALESVASAAGALAMLITIRYIAQQIELQGKALKLQGKQIVQQREALDLQGRQMALQDEELGYSYRPGLWLQVDYDKNHSITLVINGHPIAIRLPSRGIPVSLTPITQATVFSVVVNSQPTESGAGENMQENILAAALASADSLWNCESVAPNTKKWCLIGPWEKLENSNTITVKWKRPVSGGWEEETLKWTLRVMGGANPQTAEERQDCAWEIVPNPPESGTKRLKGGK